MNQYSGSPNSNTTVFVGPGNYAADTPTLLPLSARVDQLRAAIRDALIKTASITYYPQEDTPMKAEAGAVIDSQPQLLDELARAQGDMVQLLARIDRINDVIGGRL